MKQYVNPMAELILCTAEDVISCSGLKNLESGDNMVGYFSDLLWKA